MSPSSIDNVSVLPITEAAKATPNGSTPTQNGIKLSQYKNPSLQVTSNHEIKMVEAPIGKPGPGEVLLQIKATGICGYVFIRKVVSLIN